MRVIYKTFGCKTNQYDTERMRQESEARGAVTVESSEEFDVCVVNTCTVTNVADAEARKFIRKIGKEHPEAQIVVAGCSAALRGREYREMKQVNAVVEGHDPVEVSLGVVGRPELVQIDGLENQRRDTNSLVGEAFLDRRRSATRGWLKIQDGCDRKCSFCATRLARGRSQSRKREEIITEAVLLSDHHPEIVLTGVHIGHYGKDLECQTNLTELLEALLTRVPETRFRLGSIEATEIEDSLLYLVNSSEGRIAPHFHMPLQSGADPVLRKMRRWHTREEYRIRALNIAEKFPYVGLGADIITGFPGEQDEDHLETVRLVEELPYTYLHVFPFSAKDDTVASRLLDSVPRQLSRERGLQLREIADNKNVEYRNFRSGGLSSVTLERNGSTGITEDYLRVQVSGSEGMSREKLHRGVLRGKGKELHVVFDN